MTDPDMKTILDASLERFGHLLGDAKGLTSRDLLQRIEAEDARTGTTSLLPPEARQLLERCAPLRAVWREGRLAWDYEATENALCQALEALSSPGPVVKVVHVKAAPSWYEPLVGLYLQQIDNELHISGRRIPVEGFVVTDVVGLQPTIEQSQAMLRDMAATNRRFLIAEQESPDPDSVYIEKLEELILGQEKALATLKQPAWETLFPASRGTFTYDDLGIEQLNAFMDRLAEEIGFFHGPDPVRDLPLARITQGADGAFYVFADTTDPDPRSYDTSHEAIEASLDLTCAELGCDKSTLVRMILDGDITAFLDSPPSPAR